MDAGFNCKEHPEFWKSIHQILPELSKLSQRLLRCLALALGTIKISTLHEVLDFKFSDWFYTKKADTKNRHNSFIRQRSRIQLYLICISLTWSVVVVDLYLSFAVCPCPWTSSFFIFVQLQVWRRIILSSVTNSCAQVPITIQQHSGRCSIHHYRPMKSNSLEFRGAVNIRTTEPLLYSSRTTWGDWKSYLMVNGYLLLLFREQFWLI